MDVLLVKITGSATLLNMLQMWSTPVDNLLSNFKIVYLTSAALV